MPPLQKLDLMHLNDYFLAAKPVDHKHDEWQLRVIFANFTGVVLKLSHIGNTSHIPVSVLDFEWACTSTLKYFKMHNCLHIEDEMMRIITSKLALMPELRKAKFEELKVNIKQSQSSRGFFSSLFSTKNKDHC